MDYQVLQLLGPRGQADVFLAKHGAKLVVLKQLRKEPSASGPEASRQRAHDRQQLRLEAELLEAIQHPNVITSEGLAVVDGVESLVLEHVDGISLERVDGLGDELVAYIGRDGPVALAAPHAGGPR